MNRRSFLALTLLATLGCRKKFLVEQKYIAIDKCVCTHMWYKPNDHDRNIFMDDKTPIEVEILKNGNYSVISGSRRFRTLKHSGERFILANVHSKFP